MNRFVNEGAILYTVRSFEHAMHAGIYTYQDHYHGLQVPWQKNSNSMNRTSQSGYDDIIVYHMTCYSHDTTGTRY